MKKNIVLLSFVLLLISVVIISIVFSHAITEALISEYVSYKEEENCDRIPKLYYIFSNNQKIYTYCLTDIYGKWNGDLIDGKDILNDYEKDAIRYIDDVDNYLSVNKIYDDGTREYVFEKLKGFICPNSDIYVGTINMEYNDYICR